MTAVLSDICDFIHETQKERGSVSLYLRSQGREFADEMESQFLVVDGHARKLGELLKGGSEKLEIFLNAARYLPAKRKYVIARMADPAEMLIFYTREIVAPALEAVQEIAIFDTANDPRKVSAFTNFLQWKERIGLERALGTQLIELDISHSSQFRGRLAYLLSEQQAYERMFLMLADDEGRAAMEKLKAKNEVFHKVEEIHDLMRKGVTPGTGSITAVEWFRLFTAKMDLLHEIGKMMLANLTRTDEPQKPVAEEAAPAVEAEKSDVESGVETGLRAYMDCILALPLFAGLEDGTIQDILKYARVVNHHKGAMVFMQGEQASRFYIILDGWVKLFKGNIDGQESILQVLSTGENLLETVIFNNTPLPVTAQAVVETRLLSIPASILRDKLKNNNTLAVNMLSTVSGRSQALISQFEQLTLKTVTQRVGWFLLKLFLESGDRTTDLKLPYDKSLIAGYLGMKPETFSRTLQALKEQGIDIERNSVNLPDVFALCDFCDSELASRCSRHNTPECPNPQC